MLHQSIHKRTRGIRRIRDFDITDSEIDRLINSKRLDSTTVNTLCAKIQADQEENGTTPNWCVFSSWLGPLVEGKVRETVKGGYGTVEGHIIAAVRYHLSFYFLLIVMANLLAQFQGPEWTEIYSQCKDTLYSTLMFAQEARTLGISMDRFWPAYDMFF